MIVLVLLGLWGGRKSLKGVFRTALGRAGGEDDGREILSYRAAILGMVGGLVVMGLVVRYIAAWITYRRLGHGWMAIPY